MEPTGIVGRGEELGSIERFLADVDGGPTALVLEGEAGIGKTILWRGGVDAARRRFAGVLTCRGVETEATLSFSGLSELLAPVVDEVLPELASPRRRALEVALLLVEPGEVRPDVHAIGLAVLGALQVLDRRGPLLVAVDDLQWLDPASAGALQVALRRLHSERVGVLATVRTLAARSAPLDFERCFAVERCRRIEVGALGLGALRRLLRERLGVDLPRPDLVRLQVATRGNPFFGLELQRELLRTGARRTAGRDWPVPDSLAEVLGGRVTRLPTDTGDVLVQVAALARPTVDLAADVFGDRERVLIALDAAVREGLIEIDDARVSFTHPLHASICYARAPLWKRHAVHQRLAEKVTDVEERARHLALGASGPDDVVAAELEVAAEHAASRGATASAAELYEWASGLSATDASAGRRRRLRSATLHRLAGDRQRAITMLEQLRTEVPGGVERSDVLFELVSTLSGEPGSMMAVCDQALADAEGDDARGARILCKRMWIHSFAADGTAALCDARAALERAERTGDPTLIATALCSVGQAEMWTGAVTPGVLERGAEIEQRCGLVLEHMESPLGTLARLLMRQGELERSRAIHEELDRRSAARGDEHSRVQVLWLWGLLEWLAGRWQRALVLAVEARELAEQTVTGFELAWIGRMKALVEVDLGLIDEARASAAEGLAFAEQAGNENFEILSLGSLGRLELALGNLEAAASYLRDLPERLLSRGYNDPTLPVWADAIETLIALGGLERAEAYLDQYESNSRRRGSPWALSAAARCRGLLYAAMGDLDGGEAALEGALAELDGLTFPLERARTLLCLGSVRRRAQRKGAARQALDAALVIFDELGARLWADQARSELRRISGRRPPAEQLTETEYQVATLAAGGLTNGEIASALHMGVSTVESHLSRIYRKLGARRAELGSRLPLLGEERANRGDDAGQT